MLNNVFAEVFDGVVDNVWRAEKTAKLAKRFDVSKKSAIDTIADGQRLTRSRRVEAEKLLN